MNSGKITRRARLGTALAALAVAIGTVGAAAPAQAESHAARPSETLNLSAGTGTLIRLSEPMSDVFVAKDAVADVQVRSATQLYVFGKSLGETTIYATSKSGKVVYAANVRVANNVGSMNEMLHLAMPDARVLATPMNNLVLLTGFVGSPDDVEIAQRLVENYVGAGVGIVNRIRTATPLQVMLKVRIAEMNRNAVKQVGVNLLNRDTTTGNTLFGIGQGNPGSIKPIVNPADPSGLPIGGTAVTFNNIVGGTTLGLFGRILGTDILGTLDLLQRDGIVTTLAEPNLTALSGETASFLAGGEFPIPVSQSLGAITIEYKQYGVGLAFTPVVLADGRISMRVRPEVSELSNEGAIKLNNFLVPALTTRRAETTVELGSGQSFMIGGLLRTHMTNDITRAPFLGDLPVLGALFRSTSFRRDETELVIIVTPYLVRPVSDQLATPIDGFRAPNDAQEIIMGQTYSGVGVVKGVDASKYPGAGAAVAAPAAAAGAASSAAPGFKL
ncbi:MAG: type II and III secretion system protein family protein [Sphingomicrobium sp.]